MSNKSELQKNNEILEAILNLINNLPSVGSGGDCYANYLTFVGNTNADVVDAALGKNNEDIIKGVGKALAMYAWFEGADETEHPFTELQKCQSISDILNNDVALAEIEADTNISALLESSYATLSYSLAKGEIVEISVSGTYSLPQLPFNVDVCLIGGGGGGGKGWYDGGNSGIVYGGGGGAGGYMTNVYNIEASSLECSIGNGGASATAGGTTTITLNGLTYEALGGGAGTSTGAGGNGGSGGGYGGHSGKRTSTVGGSNGSSAGGTGDGLSKYPWEDETLTLYCGGGGGGGYYYNASTSDSGSAGGAGGGGTGASGSAKAGSAGTLYGAGGGGGGAGTSDTNCKAGGAGYQGAILIRKHIA